MHLRLNLKSEPYWIELGYGVAHKVRPINSALAASIRAKARRMAEEMVEHEEAARLADLVDCEGLTQDEVIAGLTEMYFATVLAQATTIEWRGWTDKEGVPMPLNDKALAAAMRQPFMAQAFIQKYLSPEIEAEEEGNG
jgi:hypothetical protein